MMSENTITNTFNNVVTANVDAEYASNETLSIEDDIKKSVEQVDLLCMTDHENSTNMTSDEQDDKSSRSINMTKFTLQESSE